MAKYLSEGYCRSTDEGDDFMAYTALYREWRPQNFASIVGQEHVTRTLINAIKTGRIAHAYIFCGPRGTGKTSTAKVMAKALNCQAPVDGVEPCNQCANCRSINEGLSYDVLEIDAASNRGIDEIRDLREKVKYAPADGRYKVYIIDEVHMLTTEAFNALLKTLEEPPPHVIFILATTEPQKVPVTILSRCQRFDFRRISLADIVSRLEEVVREKGIEAEPGVLAMIARRAEGGLRDALSLLDQCLAFCGNELKKEDVAAVLGIAGDESLLAFIKLLLAGDAPGALRWVDTIFARGRDARQCLRDTIYFLRHLMLEKVGAADVEQPAAGEREEELARLASEYPLERILSLLELLMRAEREIRQTDRPRLVFELAVIQACRGIKGQPGPQPRQPSEDEKCAGRGEKEGRRTAAGEKSSGEKVTRSREKVVPPRLWEQILAEVRKRDVPTYAFLVEGQMIEMDEERARIAFKASKSFHRQQLEDPRRRQLVEEVIAGLTGKRVRVEVCSFPEKGTAAEMVEKVKEVFGALVEEVND